jgi:hypothetical protein
VHAVREHRGSIDLVRYRLFGRDLLGLETVASVSGGMQVARRARRHRRLPRRPLMSRVRRCASWRVRSTRSCSGSGTA